MSLTPTSNTLPICKVLSAQVHVGTLSDVADCVLEKTQHPEGAYVCVANVHMVVMAERAPLFREVMGQAYIVTSDGIPLVWELRRKGFCAAERVSGPDLMDCLCAISEKKDVPLYFYGGRPRTTNDLKKMLLLKYPKLKIAGIESPPKLLDKPVVEKDVVQRIRDSGAKIVFVGLGCPKQEYWMHAYSPELNAVLIGVGAAFDFFSGRVKRAPLWMQKSGLEWFYRLCTEPRRLWKRYMVTNTVYLYLLGKSWLISFFADKKKGP